MDVRLPDGTVIKNVPDGISKADLTAKLKANGYDVSKLEAPSAPAPAAAPVAAPPASMPASDAMGMLGPLGKIGGAMIDRMTLNKGSDIPKAAAIAASGAAGAAEPFFAVGKMVDEGLKAALPESVYKFVKPELPAIRERFKKAVDAELGPDLKGLATGANIAGQVMNPVGLAVGRSIPLASSMMGRVGQGAAAGAGMGALTTAEGEGGDYASNLMTQMGAGGIVGGALPLVTSGVGSAVGGARNIIDPLLPGGNRRAAVRMANEAAGDKRQEIINLLQGAKPLETASQAATPAGRAEFAGLQKVMGEIDPSAMVAAERAQEGARRAGLAMVRPDLQAAVASRSAQAGPKYTAARMARAPVDTTAIAAGIDDLAQRNPGNAALLRELNSIKAGLYDDAGNLRANAEEVSSVIDGLKASIANKDNKFILGELNDIKKQLSDAIPGYSDAQRTFAKASAPVNQSQVLGEMQSVMAAPGGGERVTPFLNVLGRGEQALLKKSTGFPRYEAGDIDKVLSPQQLGVVREIERQMNRDVQESGLANAGVKNARDIVRSGSELTLKPPGLIDRGITIANAIIRRLEGYGGKAADQELARLMIQNPKELGMAMQQANPQARQKITEFLIRNPSVAAQIGTSMQGEQ